ncbi:hypothetical protein AL515_22490 [Citrobacter sp. FDAARGOS_156]|nr:hypothetical protein AL515_22490 [Citrobacter sp. FDAARGOS_156]
MHGINELGHVGLASNVYPVILQAADALAVSFTPVTYFCTLRGFTSSPPCCNLNYLGLIIGK